MAWDIRWLGNTREELRDLAHQAFPKWGLPVDIGEVAVTKFEEEIRLHPMPGADLPQYREDKVFDFGKVRVRYHIDSAKGEAEVRTVTVGG